MPPRRERRRRAGIGRRVGRLSVAEQPIRTGAVGPASAWRTPARRLPRNRSSSLGANSSGTSFGSPSAVEKSSTSSSNPLLVEASRSGRGGPHIWLSFLFVAIVAVVALGDLVHRSGIPKHVRNNTYSKCRSQFARRRRKSQGEQCGTSNCGRQTGTRPVPRTNGSACPTHSAIGISSHLTRPLFIEVVEIEEGFPQIALMPGQSLDEIADLDPRRKTVLKPLDHPPGPGLVDGGFVETGQVRRTMRCHDETDAMRPAESLQEQAVPKMELFDAVDRGHSQTGESRNEPMNSRGRCRCPATRVTDLTNRPRPSMAGVKAASRVDLPVPWPPVIWPCQALASRTSTSCWRLLPCSKT